MKGNVNTAKLTSDTLSEKPKPIRIGILPLMMRPLTLSQIWELGSKTEGLTAIDLQDKLNVIAETLRLKDNARTVSDMVVVMLFRSAFWRFVLGRYVRRRLTMQRYQRMMEYFLPTMRAAFFLVSITSLKGIGEITKRTNTNEATALGDL